VEKIRDYYKLTKPGVLYGNAITAGAGFLFASRGTIDWGLFAWLMIGTTLVIASACVINNYLDQDIDSLMERTKKRPLIEGKVSGRGAVLFSIILGIVGIGLLIAKTNDLVVITGIVGFIDYVWLYGMLSKRLSMYGTLVGSISGATPILAGYVAVTGTLDVGAIIVFLILFFWQMPEFYSISVYRRKEYAAAKIPVISVVLGVAKTKWHIFWFTLAYVISTLLLSIFGYAGYIYSVVMGILGVYWIWLAIKGLKTKQDDAWARKMFFFSLITLLVFCLMISIDAYLP
jgi:heme o synthase